MASGSHAEPINRLMREVGLAHASLELTPGAFTAMTSEAGETQLELQLPSGTRGTWKEELPAAHFDGQITRLAWNWPRGREQALGTCTATLEAEAPAWDGAALLGDPSRQASQ